MLLAHNRINIHPRHDGRPNGHDSYWQFHLKLSVFPPNWYFGKIQIFCGTFLSGGQFNITETHHSVPIFLEAFFAINIVIKASYAHWYLCVIHQARARGHIRLTCVKRDRNIRDVREFFRWDAG